MNDPECDTSTGPADAAAAASDAVAKKARADKARLNKARLDRVFGEVLPETTGDERGPGERRGRSDEDYLADRPPHHGG